MILTEFVFIMILIISFMKFNAGYEKNHGNISILDETKVKKTLHTFSLIDIMSRFVGDIIVAG